MILAWCSGDPLVRFTVRDGRRDSSIRMEMSECDIIDMIRETAEEYWGGDRLLLVKEYRVLDPDSNIGDSVDEGDIIDVVPYIAGKGTRR